VEGNLVNTFSPFGFRDFGERDGQAPTMGQETFALLSSDTNAYFTGDVVSVSSQSLGAFGAITLPASGSAPGAGGVLGIFTGCEYYNPTTQRNEWHPYFPGSVGSSAVGKAYVVTDPERLWIVQGTSAAVLGTSNIGWNVGFTSSETLGAQKSGNTASGISNVALNSTSAGGTSTLPFRIFATYQSYAPPGGFVNGTSSGAEGCQIMVVQGNNWARSQLTGPST
jgi:hypothetical protein